MAHHNVGDNYNIILIISTIFSPNVLLKPMSLSSYFLLVRAEWPTFCIADRNAEKATLPEERLGC